MVKAGVLLWTHHGLHELHPVGLHRQVDALLDVALHLHRDGQVADEGGPDRIGGIVGVERIVAIDIGGRADAAVEKGDVHEGQRFVRQGIVDPPGDPCGLAHDQRRAEQGSEHHDAEPSPVRRSSVPLQHHAC
jgi:hypothetical protein